MRIGIFSDVHANLHALEAVANELEEARCDRVVFLGDALGMGPRPVEVLERLRDLCDAFVIGNADAEVLEGGAPTEDEHLGRVLEIAAWTAEQLDLEHKGFLTSLPARFEAAADRLRMLAYHGSPRSFDERVDATTPPGELEELLSAFEADVYAGGHTHFQFVRRHRRALVMNPGSAGLAYDRTHPTADIRLAPFAEFALLEAAREDVRVTLGRVPFEVAAHLAALRSSGMPHAEWMAAGFGS